MCQEQRASCRRSSLQRAQQSPLSRSQDRHSSLPSKQRLNIESEPIHKIDGSSSAVSSHQSTIATLVSSLSPFLHTDEPHPLFTTTLHTLILEQPQQQQQQLLMS
ncbi:hypothetical protein MN608_04774 [Microdochium nivale]|nr:hypothetical protein MN608_04774 [Microdochium nivale]